MFARGSSSFLEDLRILKNSLRSFRNARKIIYVYILLIIYYSFLTIFYRNRFLFNRIKFRSIDILDRNEILM